MRYRVSAALALIAAFGLGACLPENGLNDNFLRLYAIPDPSPDNFYECHGFGCVRRDRIALSPQEWESVRAAFAPPAADASGERRQAAQAVARLQWLVGARTGTAAHQWTRRGGRIYPNPMGDLTQLDCIDESVNTWTYLTLIARDRLLRFHRVGPLSAAGTIFTWDIRNTAVLVEQGSATLFAVDASLVDAAQPPPIFPLADWLARWPPNLPAAESSERLDTADGTQALR